MLVIGRKKNEALIINGNIEVIVAEITGERVRLAINAPKDVVVLRRELHEAGELNLLASKRAEAADLRDLDLALSRKNCP
ncbi:MAG: carbon storage regulator [Gracilibacteraceae bacterium]|jgi:carbon storage regulator|nr:carbon storage regulator [Gracilibacteraceae bacterium]